MGGSVSVLGLSHAVCFAVGDDDGCLVREPVEHADGGGVLGQESGPLSRKWHMFVWVKSVCGLRDLLSACHAGIRGAPDVY